MNKKNILWIIICILSTVFVSCKKISISMVSSTAIDKVHPFELMNGNQWKAIENAKFVKLHIYPDESIQVKEVSLQDCGQSFSHDAQLFINFDEVSLPLEKSTNGKMLKAKLKAPVSARSLTINFGENQKVCIKNFSVDGFSLVSPKLINATYQVSMAGDDAYGVMNLFDSRYEYAWAALPQDKNVWIELDLEEQVTIDAIKIWNGYQRSDLHCAWNGRVKELQIKGENNYSQKILLKDVMGSQLVKLPEILKTKKIRLEVVSSYLGKNRAEVAISELRFLNGNKVISINPIKNIQKILESNLNKFKNAKLENVLDNDLKGGFTPNQSTITSNSAWVDTPSGLRMREAPSTEGREILLIPDKSQVEILEKQSELSQVGDVSGYWSKVNYLNKNGWVFDKYLTQNRNSHTSVESGQWILRLRSDGSLYLEGSSSQTEIIDMVTNTSSRRFYALGNYKIVKINPSSIDVELFGLLKTQTETMKSILFGGDCNGCGHDCNKLGENKDGSRGEIFVEKITLAKGEMNSVMLFNYNSNPKLGFRQLFLK